MKLFFKTSKGSYIRIDCIVAITSYNCEDRLNVEIYYKDTSKFNLYDSDAKSFLQFMDNEFVEAFADGVMRQ